MKRRSEVSSTPAPPGPKGGFRQTDRAAIPEEALTPRERKVLGVLRTGARPMTVKELGRRCFPGMRAKPGRYESTRTDGTRIRHGTAAAYRCVLNSLRRLVVGSFVERTGRGTYTAASASQAA